MCVFGPPTGTQEQKKLDKPQEGEPKRLKKDTREVNVVLEKPWINRFQRKLAVLLTGRTS